MLELHVFSQTDDNESETEMTISTKYLDTGLEKMVQLCGTPRIPAYPTTVLFLREILGTLPVICYVKIHQNT